jgi:hypothetical protein
MAFDNWFEKYPTLLHHAADVMTQASAIAMRSKSRILSDLRMHSLLHLVCGFMAIAAARNGFTSRIITSPDGNIAEDKIVTTAGSNSATATLSSAGPGVMQIVTFK